ncbi:MAG: E2/UBC family protein [Xenococcus sp. MO_188.B8]|nr:E2/UBC family protein [Xenococcus sp. MO_188.B8]
MLDISERVTILNDLIQDGCLQQARILSNNELPTIANRGVVAGVKGEIYIDSQEISLWVGIKESFPLTLPIIFLRPAHVLGIIPHLEQDGYLCYSDSEGLFLDSSNPVGILTEAVKRAIELLEKSVRDENKWDFMDEFHAYWLQLCSETTSLTAYLPIDNTLRKIYAYKTSNRYVLVADKIDRACAYFNHQNKKLDSYTRHTALYIPLEAGTFLTPPTPKQLWTVRDLQEIICKNVSADNKKKLRQYRVRENRAEELVIMGIPRPQGGMTLIGLIFSDVGEKHPLISGNSTKVPRPINVQRYDLDYLMPRGGANANLDQIKALVVGCGAVGGNIPASLVQAGIRDLTLVDPDRLKPENTYRHVMGKCQEKQYKTLAIKEEIKSKYPYLTITTHQNYIDKAISQGEIDLSDFDLAIFATGNQTMELYLNRLVHQNNLLAVLTWLEPYGIGGHSLLTRSEMPGCFQCLFNSDPTRDDYNHNRASFAAPNQSFAKNNLGCGASYTEYGALDAQKTAIQAVQLALDGLQEVEPKNALISWKGRDNRFTAAGFKTSPRYQLSSDRLEEFKYHYINPQCPICGEEK